MVLSVIIRSCSYCKRFYSILVCAILSGVGLGLFWKEQLFPLPKEMGLLPFSLALSSLLSPGYLSLVMVTFFNCPIRTSLKWKWFSPIAVSAVVKDHVVERF